MNVRRTGIPQEWGVHNIISNFPSGMKNFPIGAWALPIVVDVGTDDPFIVGTAFPIDNGVLVTAKHILREFQTATEPVNIGRTLTALQTLPGKKYVAWRSTKSIVHNEADLAVLFCPSNEDGPDYWVPPWTISDCAPRKDEWVGAFGHVAGYCSIVARNPEGGGTIELDGGGQANFGVVKNVYDEYRDRVMLPCPCFEVGAEFSPGMSGGPVFNERSEICGVVSSGIKGENSSHAVTLFPSLSQIYGEFTGRPNA